MAESITVPFFGPLSRLSFEEQAIGGGSSSSRDDIIVCTTNVGFWTYDTRTQAAASVATHGAAALLPPSSAAETLGSSSSRSMSSAWLTSASDGSLNFSTEANPKGSRIYKTTSRADALLSCGHWVTVATAEGVEITTLRVSSQGSISHVSTFMRPTSSPVLAWQLIPIPRSLLLNTETPQVMLVWLEASKRDLILQSALVSDQGVQQRPETVLDAAAEWLGLLAPNAALNCAARVASTSLELTLICTSCDGQKLLVVTASHTHTSAQRIVVPNREDKRKKSAADAHQQQKEVVHAGFGKDSVRLTVVDHPRSALLLCSVSLADLANAEKLSDSIESPVATCPLTQAKRISCSSSNTLSNWVVLQGDEMSVVPILQGKVAEAEDRAERTMLQELEEMLAAASSAVASPSPTPKTRGKKTKANNNASAASSQVDPADEFSVRTSSAVRDAITKRAWSEIARIIDEEGAIEVTAVFECLCAIALSNEATAKEATAPLMFAAVGRVWYNSTPKKAAIQSVQASAAVAVFLLLKVSLIQAIEHGAIVLIPLLVELLDGIVAAHGAVIVAAKTEQGGGISAITSVERILRGLADMTAHQPGFRLGQLTAKFGPQNELQKMPQVPEHTGRAIHTEKVQRASVVRQSTIRL